MGTLSLALVVVALLASNAFGYVPKVEERCPRACGGRNRGLCTKFGCSCFAGHTGDDCSGELRDRAPWPLARGGGGGGWQAPRTVCVASAQIPHTSLHEDVAYAIPGFSLAKRLAAEGNVVTLVFLALNGGPGEDLILDWQSDLRSKHNVELRVLYTTQHYYMPSAASQSFELYSFIRDRTRYHGRKPFDLIVLHDGHGLGYYLGLAKRQEARGSGLEGTALMVHLSVPHLWLVSQGSGIGVTSVDDIEIDFMEKEAVRLADWVSVQHSAIMAWCTARKWKFPARTTLVPPPGPAQWDSRQADRPQTQRAEVPRTWRSVGLGRAREDGKMATLTQEAADKESGVGHLVLIMQGPGGGQQGEMVSSGGNTKSKGHFKVSEDYKFDMMDRDIDTLDEIGGKLANESAVINALKRATILVAGMEDKLLPYQMKRRISDIGASLKARAPHLSFDWAALKYSEAVAFLSETNGGAGGEKNWRRIFVPLADYHRDSLTFEWLYQLLAQGRTTTTAFLSKSTMTRKILSTAAGSGLEGESSFLSPSVDDLVAGILSIFEEGGGVCQGAEEEESAPPEAFSASIPSVLSALSSHLEDGPLLPVKMQGMLAQQTSWTVVKNVAGYQGMAQGSSPGKDEFLHASSLPFVSVVITHYNRPDFLDQAVKSVTFQSYPEDLVELIVIDDGSPNPGTREKLVALRDRHRFDARGWRVMFEPNRYLGGARNTGAGYAKGKYILFMDDDNYAKSYEVEHFVRAMENTHADLLTSGLDFITGKGEPESDACFRGSHGALKCLHRETKMRVAGETGSRPRHGDSGDSSPPLVGRASPSFVFLGASANVGLFKNCYGDANSFFRSASFADLGGYTTDKQVGYEDWEVYSKAALGGWNLQTVPKAMYFYRFTSGSMQKTTSYRQSRKRALRAYTN